MPATLNRNALIKAIHTGSRALGLRDDEYRAILNGATHGKNSCRDMTVQELVAVLRVLRRNGFENELAPTTALAFSLWHQLYDNGNVRMDTPQALGAYIVRIHMALWRDKGAPVDALRKLTTSQLCRSEWVDSTLVIETLKKWLAREDINA